jgi:hypothetical protein
MLRVCGIYTDHHHHHHHWLDSPAWAPAFLRSFCQLKYLTIGSSDFVTKVFIVATTQRQLT